MSFSWIICGWLICGALGIFLCQITEEYVSGAWVDVNLLCAIGGPVCLIVWILFVLFLIVSAYMEWKRKMQRLEKEKPCLIKMAREMEERN